MLLLPDAKIRIHFGKLIYFWSPKMGIQLNSSATILFNKITIRRLGEYKETKYDNKTIGHWQNG